MPDNLQQLQNAIQNMDLPPWLGGVVMAFMMSVFRVWMDDRETAWRRMLVEGLMCAGFTWAAGAGMIAAGFGPHWYLPLGGLIGGIGSQAIRACAYRWLKSKTK